jgi:hypothetical protein
VSHEPRTDSVAAPVEGLVTRAIEAAPAAARCCDAAEELRARRAVDAGARGTDRPMTHAR